ncbi:hypothetical protein ACLSSQ_09375 [Azospira sp. APE16]|uniref:hypothetical protein n=1 Tax=Azospira sp. APE16 TaxID=3394231 RepID=UPI003A4D5453
MKDKEAEKSENVVALKLREFEEYLTDADVAELAEFYEQSVMFHEKEKGNVRLVRTCYSKRNPA